eukprot:205221_1
MSLEQSLTTTVEGIEPDDIKQENDIQNDMINGNIDNDKIIYTQQSFALSDIIPYLIHDNILTSSVQQSSLLTHPFLNELSSIIKSFCGENCIFLNLPARLIKNNQYKKLSQPKFWCHSNLSNKWFFLCQIIESKPSKKAKHEETEGKQDTTNKLPQSQRYIIFEYNGQSTELISYKPIKWNIMNTATYKKYTNATSAYDLQQYTKKHQKASIGAIACDHKDTIFLASAKKIVYFSANVKKNTDKYSKISGKIKHSATVSSSTGWRTVNKNETICGLFSQTNYKLNKEIIYFAVSQTWTQ